MKIKLWENGTPYYNESYGQEEPWMKPFPVDTSKGKVGCVIAFPGGGYGGLADYEGDPIAEYFQSQGYYSFSVTYRVDPYRYPAITDDGARAVRWVRYHADELGIDPEKIAVVGFSAGGHLACFTATHFDDGKEGDEIDAVSSRPNAAILCYPVVTLTYPYTHEGTRLNLLSGNPDIDKLAFEFSGENSVTGRTPPMFIWHNIDDSLVPVENSLHLAEVLSKAKIPYELHLFPKGDHGGGLAFNVPGDRNWAPLAAEWLKEFIF
ncbi:MAG: alpha/beta hydrolase [Clostridia bacterium]|nr:alpha/beta hydrolase [Clostridia bacterium]